VLPILIAMVAPACVLLIVAYTIRKLVASQHRNLHTHQGIASKNVKAAIGSK